MPLIDFRQARGEGRPAFVRRLLGWASGASRGAQVRGLCSVHGSFLAEKRFLRCPPGGASAAASPARRRATPWSCGSAGRVRSCTPMGRTWTGNPVETCLG